MIRCFSRNCFSHRNVRHFGRLQRVIIIKAYALSFHLLHLSLSLSLFLSQTLTLSLSLLHSILSVLTIKLFNTLLNSRKLCFSNMLHKFSKLEFLQEPSWLQVPNKFSPNFKDLNVAYHIKTSNQKKIIVG